MGGGSSTLYSTFHLSIYLYLSLHTATLYTPNHSSRVMMRIPIHFLRVVMGIHSHSSRLGMRITILVLRSPLHSFEGSDENPHLFLKSMDDDPNSLLKSRDEDSNTLLKGRDEDSHSFLKGSDDDSHSFLQSRDEDPDSNTFLKGMVRIPSHSLRVVGWGSPLIP